MEALTKEQRIDQAGELFKRFLTHIMDIDSLHDALDELELKHAMALLEQDEMGHVRRGDDVYMLHQLKLICRLKDVAD